MAERTNAQLLKSCEVQASVGSNPTPSAHSSRAEVGVSNRDKTPAGLAGRQLHFTRRASSPYCISVLFIVAFGPSVSGLISPSLPPGFWWFFGPEDRLGGRSSANGRGSRVHRRKTPCSAAYAARHSYPSIDGRGALHEGPSTSIPRIATMTAALRASYEKSLAPQSICAETTFERYAFRYRCLLRHCIPGLSAGSGISAYSGRKRDDQGTGIGTGAQLSGGEQHRQWASTKVTSGAPAGSAVDPPRARGQTAAKARAQTGAETCPGQVDPDSPGHPARILRPRRCGHSGAAGWLGWRAQAKNRLGPVAQFERAAPCRPRPTSTRTRPRRPMAPTPSPPPPPSRSRGPTPPSRRPARARW